MSRPLMRAAHTRALLAEVERFDAAERSRVLSLLGAAKHDEIATSPHVGWLPFGLHMDLSNAVRAVVGPSRNVVTWRATMASAFDRPLFRSFVKMATTLFGSDPFSLLRHCDRVYGQLTREIGTLTYEASTTSVSEGHIELTGFPAGEYDFPCYVEGLQGCLQTALALSGGRGDVDVVEQDPRGRARYRIVTR